MLLPKPCFVGKNFHYRSLVLEYLQWQQQQEHEKRSDEKQPGFVNEMLPADDNVEEIQDPAVKRRRLQLVRLTASVKQVLKEMKEWNLN